MQPCAGTKSTMANAKDGAVGEQNDNDCDGRNVKDNAEGQEAEVEEPARVALDELPDEILEFILSYLPPYKDLENCSLVCKRWRDVVCTLIRRSKLNLFKGLTDYRLRWETCSAVNTDTSPAGNSTCTILSFNIPHVPIIAGRFSHSAVRHGNSMYIFGGGSSSDTTFNDLWRFDLSEMRWERPLCMGSYPSPKGSASMVCWKEQLVLFGGWRYPSLHPPYQPWCLFDELHYYDLATQRWTVSVTLPSPPPLAGHSASVHGDYMVIFGGYQIIEGVNSNSNETWCLDLCDGRWWQPRIAGNTKPPPRYGQFQLVLDAQHLLIVGGCGGPNSVYSDAWLLDMSEKDGTWSWRPLPVRNKKYSASHMWCNPACKVGNKLVVLGPTPNMPQDFQMMRQMRVPVGGGTVPRGVVPNHGQRRVLVMERQRPAGEPNHPGRIVAYRARVDNFRLPPIVAMGGPGIGFEADQRQAEALDQYYANRRAILNQHQQQANNNFFNNINNNVSNQPTTNNSNSNNNNSLQPRTGRLRDLHVNSLLNSILCPASTPSTPEEHNPNQNRPNCTTASTSGSGSGCGPGCLRVNGASTSNNASSLPTRNDNEVAASSSAGANASNGSASNKDLDAASRLQRNLALRCRENEPLLPKRFDELYEDPFRMAAFNVPSARPRGLSKDHSERIRRMEEKMNAIRNSRKNAAAEQVGPSKCLKEPSPKRVKRNVLSLFVCDLSAALNPTDPHLQWVEYKNYGILPGAPERLILSTMVPGNGELILFGGVHKETLSEITHQVSNSVHFLSAPHDIV